MNGRTTSISDALDQFVPPFGPDPGDWDEIMRRAGGPALPAENGTIRPSELGRLNNFRRGARQRPTMALAILVALVLVPVSALAVSGQVPLSDWPFFRSHKFVPRGFYPAKGTHVVIVKSGSTNGHGWVLAAFRNSNRQLCVGIAQTIHDVPSRTGGSGLGCGSLTQTSIGTGLSGDGQPASPYFSRGTAAEKIVEVEIYLADGTIIRTPTIPAPKALRLPIRFYITQIPAVACPDSSRRRLEARITKYVGLASSGSIVGSVDVPLPPPGVPLDYLCPTKGTFGPSQPTRQLSPSAAIHSLKPALRLTATNGATATLSISHTVTITPARLVQGPRGTIHVPAVKARCWRITFSVGQPQSDCETLIPTGPWISVLGVQPAGHDVFIVAQSHAPVTRASLRFGDGDTISARPLGGIVVFAVPRAHLSTSRQRANLTGYDSKGRKVGYNTRAYFRVRLYDKRPEPQ